MTKIFCLALTIFFLSCSTSTAVRAVALPLPQEPAVLQVFFEPVEGGLFLSDADYRNLEKNITRLRSYVAELKLHVEHYNNILESENE